MYHRPLAGRLSARLRYAGIHREGAARQANITDMSWVKAHREKDDIDQTNATEVFHFTGNEHADDQAKQARVECRPAFSDKFITKVHRLAEHTKLFCSALCAILLLWPPVPKDLVRAVPPEEKAAGRPKPTTPLAHIAVRAHQSHSLAFSAGGGRVVCSQCAQATSIRQAEWTVLPCKPAVSVDACHDIRVLPRHFSRQFGGSVLHISHGL